MGLLLLTVQPAQHGTSSEAAAAARGRGAGQQSAMHGFVLVRSFLLHACAHVSAGRTPTIAIAAGHAQLC